MAARRETKKLETRQRISDVATELFLARGFEAVTLDDIAAGADVSKMTVLNYFGRKEDLMLDRQDDLRLVFFRETMRARAPGESPVGALRRFMRALQEEKHHVLTRFDRRTAGWWRFVARSPSLEARLRELDAEAAEGLAVELGGPRPDGRARLAAGLIVLTVRTARRESLGVIERGGSQARAKQAFFDLVERGFAAADELSSPSQGAG